MVAVQRGARHHDHLGVKKQHQQVAQSHAVRRHDTPHFKAKAHDGRKRNDAQADKLHDFEKSVEDAQGRADSLGFGGGNRLFGLGNGSRFLAHVKKNVGIEGLKILSQRFQPSRAHFPYLLCRFISPTLGPLRSEVRPQNQCSDGARRRGFPQTACERR